MEDDGFISDLGSPALMVLANTAEAAQAASLHHVHVNLPTNGVDPNHPGSTMNLISANCGTLSGSLPQYNQLLTPNSPISQYSPVLPSQYSPATEGSTAVINSQGGGVFHPVTVDSKLGKARSTSFEETKILEHVEAETNKSCENVSPKSSKQDRETNDGKGGLATPNNQDEGRSGLRSRSRKRVHTEPQTLCCPVCGVTLRPGEIQCHLAVEAEKLDKIFRGSRKSSNHGNRDAANSGTSRKVIPCKQVKEGPSSEVQCEARYDSYLRVKAARQSRLSGEYLEDFRDRRTQGWVKQESLVTRVTSVGTARARRKRRPEEETTCPVCNEAVTGSPEELNEHVDQCLRKRGEEEEDDDVAIDVDGEEEEDEYEEYTWAGQTRIRATTLLPGGLGASGFSTARRAPEEEDADLDVDGDDSQEYGHQQYSEADLIPTCTSDEPSEKRERIALRGACLEAEGSSVSPTSSERTRTRWSLSDESPLPSTSGSQSRDSNGTPIISGQDQEHQSPSIGRGSSEEIIESLKAKIREQQDELQKRDQYKCLICMETYQTPLASIQCWHVHCEECWLRTLGAKKLCPQCNMITSPADLRKIYL